VPKENTVIKMRALVDSYNGQIQFVIQRWALAAPGECDPSRFIPVSTRGKDNLLGEFFALVHQVADPELEMLLGSFISSPLFSQYIIAPAAKSIHHACLHDLLEHSVDVANKALAMADKGTDWELLITGALLHDIGKIKEYDWSGCTITKTVPGYLWGHITLGLVIVDGLCPNMNPAKTLQLGHLIASHHGRLEYGSPVEPQTKEAVILHTADMLDYQYNAIDQAMEDTHAGNEWTPKVAGLGREFYVGAGSVNVEEEANHETGQAADQETKADHSCQGA
jgi:3'-5' exoribonuclease